MNPIGKTLRGLAVMFCIVPLAAFGASGQANIKVMLLTGQCSKYHNWAVSSVVLKRILDAPGCFTVETVTTPPPGANMSGFHPAFTNYDVVVMDYDGDDWPTATQQAFADYVSRGGGLVTFHDTDNAFPKWPEWNTMIGVGGWRGRNETWGPKVRWRDGKMVLDNSPGTAGHPAPHEFLIEVRAPEHPIMKGLPPRWLHARDELYSQLRGPATNLTVLATAFADNTRFRGASGEHEPMLMTVDYGKGRVLHLAFGHVGPADTEQAASVNCVDFICLLQRGTEWAATGGVTQPVPADFPTAEQTSIRK
jgi:type 1 glutamine amidotransferase